MTRHHRENSSVVKLTMFNDFRVQRHPHADPVRSRSHADIAWIQPLPYAL